ncbi:SDR family NAD(P)-dependent oxidoreductase [Chengkuizengella axinellae]|uniref:SDR family NAD(P)-dependent oxidoreductase n=1 Tax=Chengkuizengella axinellae TaxID=3064388 RepID=A0ABT9J358_9BACL|nr:SDR family NAD(P)-dependent oxidoreductase [Chengkuizengella sp. 2205SS18-9]MDP5276042.1 SDR family NAD(P)-dependent oxidoreductase [Chengkuizengella sp. 2205SS18-9]
MLKKVLITGANSGLGKESARQLAEDPTIEKIYLGCRNKKKAMEAKKELESVTGRKIFEIIMIDVSNLDSVRHVVDHMKEPIDGIVMNAGGFGGSDFMSLTPEGTTRIYAVNVLGHAMLLERLLEQSKLTSVGIFVGTEVSRGVKGMAKRPELKQGSVGEFTSIANGTFWEKDITDAMIPYGYVKLMGVMWMSSLARKYPKVRLLSMSPGGTAGTEGTSSMPTFKRMFTKSLFEVSVLLGKMHRVDVGARRYIDGLTDLRYKSAVFYASKKGVTGDVGDQGMIFDVFNNKTFQDNARKAVLSYIRH